MEGMRRASPVLAVLAVLGSATPAFADPNARELQHDVAIDATATATAAILLVGSELGKRDLAPAACSWCDRDERGRDTLNGVDEGVRELRWQNARLAGGLSDITGFVAAPVAAFGTLGAAGLSENAGAKVPVDALLALEAVTTAGVVTQVVKLVAGRARPFVHAYPKEVRAGLTSTPSPPDDNLSFFSGHTSLTFALAASTGTLAELRNYRLAPLVWATGMPIAALTGYLRIAADKHYFSDVLVGALVGSVVGAGLPLAFHRRRAEDPQAAAATAGAATPASRPPGLVTFGGAF
jgi:membrane-associated phospholipid phosphatase